MTEPAPIPDAEVAGLLIPGDLAVEVIAAFRELYPLITDGKDDEAAVRACLVWFITSTMETVATRRAQVELNRAVGQLEAKVQAEVEERGRRIKAAIGRIKEKPVSPEPLG